MLRSTVLLSFLALASNFCEAKRQKVPTENVASLPKRGGGGLIDPRNVDTLECSKRATFDFGQGSAVAIQTPNYPDNYPDRSRCRWFFDVPAGAELSLFCETFDVKRGDRFCIEDYNNYNYGCYYGTLDEPTEFPFTFNPSDYENSIYIRFKANRRKNAGGFR